MKKFAVVHEIHDQQVVCQINRTGDDHVILMTTFVNGVEFNQRMDCKGADSGLIAQEFLSGFDVVAARGFFNIAKNSLDGIVV